MFRLACAGESARAVLRDVRGRASAPRRSHVSGTGIVVTLSPLDYDAVVLRYRSEP